MIGYLHLECLLRLRKGTLGKFQIEVDTTFVRFYLEFCSNFLFYLVNKKENSFLLLLPLLGLEEGTAIPGKMSVYLHRFRPAHYQALMEAGIVQKVIDSDRYNGGSGWKSRMGEEPGWGQKVLSPNYGIVQNYL